MLLPLNYIPVFVVPLLEQKAAPMWMIRTALASATADQRAFLFEQIRQKSQAHWRKEPLSCRAVFSMLAEARDCYGDKKVRKPQRRITQLQA